MYDFDYTPAEADDEMLFESSLTTIDTPEGSKRAITTDYDILRQIVRTEKFVYELENVDSPCFEVHRNKHDELVLGKIGKGETFIRLLLCDVTSIPQRFPEHRYSPAFMLFLKTVKKHGLASQSRFDVQHPIEGLQAFCKRLNICLMDMRKERLSARFERSLLKHTKSSYKNYRGALRYVDHLFTQRKNLLVIRLDLRYLQQYRWGSKHDMAVSLEECFEHRAEFIRQLLALIPQNTFVRYIWKTEYKPAQSVHHHFIIFLDASQSRQGITIAKILGDHWERVITQGRGDYWNINAKFDEHDPRSGIGRVHASDARKVANLKEDVVGYLCKPDFHVRWAVPGSYRTFGKSEERQTVRRNRSK